MKNGSSLCSCKLFVALAPILLCGCVGIQYTDHVVAEDILLHPPPVRNTTVLANAEQWRNSGVIVRKNHTYTITASGKWYVGGAANWTGPNGLGAAHALAWDNTIKILQGFSWTSLIGKIGDSGSPFYVGDRLRLNPEHDGTLYFRINDGANYCGDNQGSVEVEVTATDVLYALGDAQPREDARPRDDDRIRVKSPASSSSGRRTPEERDSADARASGDARKSAPPQKISRPPIDLPRLSGPPLNVAVLDLRPLGVQESEAVILSENLRNSLVDTEYFAIASRADMSKILDELKFQNSDFVDSAAELAKVGKALSVNKIVAGSIGKVGDTYSIALRMVDVETSRIDFTVNDDIKAEADELLPAIRYLGRKLAAKYAEQQK